MGLVFQSRVSEDILVDHSFIQGNIHRVPGGQVIVVVIHLHEQLGLELFGDLLLTHGSCHFVGIVVNAGHPSMPVGMILDVVINVLHNGELCLASARDQHHLPGLQQLGPFSGNHLDPLSFVKWYFSIIHLAFIHPSKISSRGWHYGTAS